MKGIDNPSSSSINDQTKKILHSPLTGHRRSLVQNIQTENEIEESHHPQTLSTFLSLTLHSLGIIFGDM
jgi:hypothetical protein